MITNALTWLLVKPASYRGEAIMNEDFESNPVGTAAKLKELEAEIERLKDRAEASEFNFSVEHDANQELEQESEQLRKAICIYCREEITSIEWTSDAQALAYFKSIAEEDGVPQENSDE